MYFWIFYSTVGLGIGVAFLLIGMLTNIKIPENMRSITPFEMIMNMLICVWIWPFELVLWYSIHNDDDGPWSG